MKNADQWIAPLTHHLGNQLSATQAYLELFLSGALDAEQSQHLAANLFDLTKHTTVSLTNFALWFKKETLTARPAPTELKTAISQALEDFQSIAKNKGIALTLNPSPAGKVLADPLHLQIILRNLVDNALKFTPTGGSVTLTSSEAVVKISDTGMGMGHSAFGTRNEKGFGLGLKLSEKLVSLQNGKLTWVSEPHKGSTFTLTLPPA